MGNGRRSRRVVGWTFWSCIAVVASARSARAETVLNGGSLGSQTWTAAGSPYLVKGNLKLESLTVEAGTVVRFDSLPEVPQGLLVSVEGPLVIDASAQAPAIFEPLVERTYWFGIQAETAVVNGAILRWGQAGIGARSATVPMVVRESEFERSQLQPRGPLEVESSKFFNSAAAVLGGSESSDIVVKNSLFRSSTRGGWALDVRGNVTVVNCTFDGFDAAFSVFGEVAVQNSIFTNLRRLIDHGDIAVSASLLWKVDRELPDRALIQGDGIVRADPLYAAGDELRLQEGSPAIDSGLTAGAPDRDLDGGSRPQGAGVDMGAYEVVVTPAGGGGQGGEGQGGDEESGGASLAGSSNSLGGAPASPTTAADGGAAKGEDASEAGRAGAESAKPSNGPAEGAGADSSTASGCGFSALRPPQRSKGWAALVGGLLLAAFCRAGRRPR